MTKFENYSNASKARQALIPKAERIKRARQLARMRWQNTTPEERKAHSEKMLKAKSINQ